ncbi:DUF3194 domain-containing protein [Thermococcus celer]|uniref:DUF3194 domain-containing protein n=1 Tax=Thermococcus celer Vu 13 = JCM 8558 TaxID=1293037 RepID=A0A218P456_THECE|nr:DUF3194 domain-containing protein [Thermococcus celer]ASI99710.1 hypothetical protein A3L02_09120 [Thermococcus celer Vu 13 = JCM 8558]
MGGEGKRVIHIGLPELSEEELIEIGELAQETVMKSIFGVLNRSDVKDVEVTTRINRGETLDLELEVYLEVPVFVRIDVDRLIEEAVERAYNVVERRLREIADEGKAQA